MRQISLINPPWQMQLMFCSHFINNPPSLRTAALHPSTSGESPQTRLFYLSVSQHPHNTFQDLEPLGIEGLPPVSVPLANFCT